MTEGRRQRTEFGSWNVEVGSSCYVSGLPMADEAASLIEKESSALPV
ncbi:hypothetical protein D1BOALGB6SA_7402 [Olavius sp. associated proteobacterium Delta 1]|nr:hypothetical protein D1BOALGB6SA_7402 [Olavius sp. associated proteobacterium Delta 1]